MSSGRISKSTLKTIIGNLGVPEFDELTKAVIEAATGVATLNVDGSGDSGVDLVDRARATGASPRCLASQLTVQKDGWQSKLRRDAKKVADLGGFTRFYFATSKDIGRAHIERAQEEVFNSHGIHCTIYGARELAELTIDNELEDQLIRSLGVSSPMQRRLTGRERILHLMASCSDEASDVRESVHEDVLLCVLAQDGHLRRSNLLARARGALGVDEARVPAIASALDSLLVRGIITHTAPDRITISETARQGITTTADLFDAELSGLLESLAPILDEKSIQQSERLAITVLACQSHCAAALDAARMTDEPLAYPSLLRLPSAPRERLKRKLQRYYPDIEGRNATVRKIIGVTATSPLVLRLARAYLYAFLQHNNALRAIRAFGATDWKDVASFIDASVAIPLFCSRLFGEVQGPFPEGSLACLDAIQRLGAPCLLAPAYLEECSTHLIKALDYTPLASQVDALAYSRNGFVSHYARLVRERQDAPDSLGDFINAISQHAANDALPWAQRVKLCSADIAELARSFGLRTPEALQSDSSRRTSWEASFTRVLAYRDQVREHILVRHDALILAQAENYVVSASGRDVPSIIVTWDGALIECVQSDDSSRVQAFAPAHLSDLVSSLADFESPQLVTLAVDLARIEQSGARQVGDLLDSIARHCGTSSREWQLRVRESELRDALRARVANSEVSFTNWVETTLEPMFSDPSK